MLKSLPIKKEYLLIAGTLIMLLICYEFAFSKTIALWQTHQQLKAKLDSSSNVSYQPGYLERKNENLDNVLSLYKTDTLGFRNNSVTTIALIGEKCGAKLVNIPSQDQMQETEHIIIEKLDIEGDYFSLLKTVDMIQSAQNVGLVRAETIRVGKDNLYGVSNKKMTMTVFTEVINNVLL
jgi:hypothetical protein